MIKLMKALYLKHLFFLLILGGLFCNACSSYKEWSPKENKIGYKKAMKEVKHIEVVSNFFAIEKKVIKNPSEAYYEARWAFIKDLYYDNTTVSSPRKPLKKFIDFCSESFISKVDKIAFTKAAGILGFELITDRVAFETPSNTYKEYKNIAYVTHNGYSQNLDLFLPNSPQIKPVPCIVFIHGGGWRVHKRAWFEAFARYVADKGYAAVTIDYRMLHEVDSPIASVNDAKAAVRWVRANAKKYGIDPNKIGASGASAGAQLAAILATSSDNQVLNGIVGNTQVSSEIQAAVGFATPSMTGNRKTWPWSRGEKPVWYNAISPYQHITKNAAPMKFVHGTADKTVAIEEAKEMHAKYIKLGIQTEFESIEGKGHVFYMNAESAERAFLFFKKVFEN